MDFTLFDSVALFKTFFLYLRIFPRPTNVNKINRANSTSIVKKNIDKKTFHPLQHCRSNCNSVNHTAHIPGKQIVRTGNYQKTHPTKSNQGVPYTLLCRTAPTSTSGIALPKSNPEPAPINNYMFRTSRHNHEKQH